MRTDKNPIERRLHEVEQSHDEVRAEIKRLERALKNPERLLQRPHLLPTTSPLMPRIRPAANVGAPVPESSTHVVPVSPAEPTSTAQGRHIPVSGNETFARYFSSTRFLGQLALGRERHIQLVGDLLV